MAETVLVVKEQVRVSKADAVGARLDDGRGVVAAEGAHGLGHDVAARAVTDHVADVDRAALLHVEQLIAQPKHLAVEIVARDELVALSQDVEQVRVR